jgi:hypothetical protein
MINKIQYGVSMELLFIVNLIGIYLVVFLWRCKRISITSKIILSVLCIVLHFLVPLGFGSTIGLIVIYFAIRLHGEKIR